MYVRYSVWVIGSKPRVSRSRDPRSGRPVTSPGTSRSDRISSYGHVRLRSRCSFLREELRSRGLVDNTLIISWRSRWTTCWRGQTVILLIGPLSVLFFCDSHMDPQEARVELHACFDALFEYTPWTNQGFCMVALATRPVVTMSCGRTRNRAGSSNDQNFMPLNLQSYLFRWYDWTL